MAEAVFAGEEIEKLALQETATGLAPLNAIFTRLAKDLFMRHSPRDTGYRNGENEEHEELLFQIHHLSPAWFVSLI